MLYKENSDGISYSRTVQILKRAWNSTLVGNNWFRPIFVPLKFPMLSRLFTFAYTLPNEFKAHNHRRLIQVLENLSSKPNIEKQMNRKAHLTSGSSTCTSSEYTTRARPRTTRSRLERRDKSWSLISNCDHSQKIEIPYCEWIWSFGWIRKCYLENLIATNSERRALENTLKKEHFPSIEKTNG